MTKIKTENKKTPEIIRTTENGNNNKIEDLQ